MVSVMEREQLISGVIYFTIISYSRSKGEVCRQCCMTNTAPIQSAIMQIKAYHKTTSKYLPSALIAVLHVWLGQYSYFPGSGQGNTHIA